MDEISDRMHKLSRELDVLDEDSAKYKVEKNQTSREEQSGKTNGWLPGEDTVIAVLFSLSNGSVRPH